MVLYTCPTCGKWADVSFGKFLKDSWNKAFEGSPNSKMPLTYPCEDGHGLMVQVQPTDRLSIKRPLGVPDPSAIMSIQPIEEQQT